ncbi:hypothetical protein, partial [Heyndrickxia sporothermodurans]|uniref:hypothetical protein n=1 Tax=Heyndrickxia sporothermodurans TaxID=46224 RepID=UPI0035DDEBE7
LQTLLAFLSTSTVLLRHNYSREILDGWQVFFLYKNKVQRYVLLLFITLHFYFAIHIVPSENKE